MIKSFLLTVAISLVTLPLSISSAAPAQGAPLPATKAVQQSPWLGVALETVPPALVTQLAGVIPSGQGVMVQNVAPNSPAEKAGLQAHDVLLAFGDQQLYSPQQLLGLVRASKPDNSIVLKVVQQGQLKDITVTIGGRAIPAAPRQNWNQLPQWSNRSLTPMPAPPAFQPRQQQQQQAMVWDSFQSVQVNTLPDGRYRASVSYKAPNGEDKNFTFEGRRDEIIQQINQQPDIPADKKQTLLNALDMKMDDFFNQPFFRNNMFNDPFFRNGFGQDPFFRQGFPSMPSFQQYFQNPSVPRVPELQPHGEVL